MRGSRLSYDGKVAEYLKNHPKVAWVRYPTLTDPELIRLSVGIEHIDDILADLSESLAAI